jgi:hypothetical protein
MDRATAINKLIDSFHLSVEERREFEASPVGLDEAILGVARIFNEHGCYLSSWSRDEDFDGVLLESAEIGISALHMAEVGMSRYSVLSDQQYPSLEIAAKFALEKMFTGNIDGVPVGW